eukprot:scaffold25403_cov44-Attheya_sp.AAC.2
MLSEEEQQWKKFDEILPLLVLESGMVNTRDKLSQKCTLFGTAFDNFVAPRPPPSNSSNSVSSMEIASDNSTRSSMDISSGGSDANSETSVEDTSVSMTEANVQSLPSDEDKWKGEQTFVNPVCPYIEFISVLICCLFLSDDEEFDTIYRNLIFNFGLVVISQRCMNIRLQYDRFALVNTSFTAESVFSSLASADEEWRVFDLKYCQLVFEFGMRAMDGRCSEFDRAFIAFISAELE